MALHTDYSLFKPSSFKESRVNNFSQRFVENLCGDENYLEQTLYELKLSLAIKNLAGLSIIVDLLVL